MHTETHLAPIYEVKDPRFEYGQIGACELCIEIGKNRFRFAIYHTQIQAFIWLEDYQIITLLNENQLLQTLKRIYHEHPFLANNYWKSIIISNNSDFFTLVPDELYRKDEAARYLNFAAGNITTETHQLFDYQHSELEATLIYGVGKNLMNWFKEMYPIKKIRPLHVINVLLTCLARRGNPDGIHLHFEEGNIVVLVYHKNKLVFCNKFTFKTPTDMAYYVLFVANQLGLAADIPTYLYGEVTSFSESYGLLSATLENLRFVTLPQDVAFASVFEEMPEHRYYSLFSLLRFTESS